jgi:hypothetical protein
MSNADTKAQEQRPLLRASSNSYVGVEVIGVNSVVAWVDSGRLDPDFLSS